MEVLSNYVLYFIFYSFLGWLMEVTCKLISEKRFINRGFLIGPICPIYGYGVLSIILLIGSKTTDYLSVFLKAIFICSILEYFTSYFMEKIFSARWWDYSNKKFNINGRICLETMIPFGILGCLVIYIIHPLMISFVNLLNQPVKITLAFIFMTLYIIDNVISFHVMSKIKNEIKKRAVDSTEQIRKKVLDWIDSNSILYRHIKNAYPKFQIVKRMVVDKIGKSI